jgi:hypothetical protein
MTVKEEGPCKVNRSMIRCQDMQSPPTDELSIALSTADGGPRPPATHAALDAALKRAAEAEEWNEAAVTTLRRIRVALGLPESSQDSLTVTADRIRRDLEERDATIEVLRDHLAEADELAVRRGEEVETRDATIADLRETLAKTQGQLDGYRARDLDHARDL